MAVTITELSMTHLEIRTPYPKVNILFGFFCSTQNPTKHVNKLRKSTSRIVEQTERPKKRNVKNKDERKSCDYLHKLLDEAVHSITSNDDNTFTTIRPNIRLDYFN